MGTERTSIVFHGTNGWFETEIGSTACVGVYGSTFTVFFDMGTGFRNIDVGKTRNSNVIVFLSHLHFDHIYGIHLLPRYSFQSLTIYVPEHLFLSSKEICNTPFIKDLDTLPFPVELRPISEGAKSFSGFQIQAAKLEHNTCVFGYAIIFCGRKVAYCTDTIECEGLYELCEGSDLLIIDSGQRIDSSKSENYHLNMAQSAKIAAERNVEKIAFFHFGATRYLSVQERFEEAEKVKDIFPNYVVALDNMKVDI